MKKGLDLFIILAQLFLIEFLFFEFIPDRFTSFAPYYRKPTWVQQVLLRQDSEASQRSSMKGYPLHYFKSDPELGIDITPNSPATPYVMADARLDIFSNDLGCFDRNTSHDVNDERDFDYFAGDSFTWGYAPYEDKFPTVYENLTRRLTLKCGVTNTGTLHQFLKFKRIASNLQRYPRKVFIGYYMNDPDNDAIFPHSTVVKGHMVDTYFYQGKTLKAKDLAEVTKRIEQFENIEKGIVPRVEQDIGIVRSVHALLQQRSIIYNVISMIAQSAFAEKSGSIYLPSEQNWYSFSSDYLENPITKRNREALHDWKRDADQHGYDLEVLLIPPKESFSDTLYYRQLHEFLESERIAYIDFSDFFKNKSSDAEDLYWKLDRHLNPSGNRLIAEVLAKRAK